jgi:sec-independent protein translocase protein TatA
LLRNIGWPEVLLIAIVVLLLFGGRRIPELMRSLGSGIKEFKKGMRDGAEEKPPEPDQRSDKAPDEKAK